MTGLIVTVAPAHQVATWSTRTGWPSWVWADVAVVEVDVERHAPSGALGVVGVEGELAAADLAQGHGAANLEGFAAGVGELDGPLRDGGLDVAGIGQVEQAVDGDVAVDAGLVEVEVEAAGVAVATALELLGVVEGPGGLDGAAELGPRQVVGVRGDGGVDERGAVEGQGEGEVGHPHRPPDLDLAVQDPLPEPGRRYFSSRALPSQGRPAESDLPRVVSSSTTSASETAGTPSPPRRSSPSP